LGVFGTWRLPLNSSINVRRQNGAKRFFEGQYQLERYLLFSPLNVLKNQFSIGTHFIRQRKILTSDFTDSQPNYNRSQRSVNSNNREMSIEPDYALDIVKINDDGNNFQNFDDVNNEKFNLRLETFQISTINRCC
jgi:hypothetical protein